jgi:transcriptional regulator with XRE-family HTH domain
MTRMVDDLASRIAARVQTERLKRNWSLAELASHSGVSKAMLSAIERSETSPTAALLVRISTAFDMTLSTLIAHAEASSGNLARADVQPVWTDPGTGYVRRHLSPRTDMPLELVRVELPVGRMSPTCFKLRLYPSADMADRRPARFLGGRDRAQDGAR